MLPCIVEAWRRLSDVKVASLAAFEGFSWMSGMSSLDNGNAEAGSCVVIVNDKGVVI